MKKTFFVLFVLSSLIVPSLAALTEYQTGFEAGLKAGFTLGQSYQQSNDGKISTNQYDQVAASYNALIQSLFAGNQTAINALLVPTTTPVQLGANAAYPGLPSSGRIKPLHGVDASWNQSLTQTVNPDEKGLIHGYDPDTYYTMVGWGGSGLATLPKDASGNYIQRTDSNGNAIDPSLQPP